uniref:protein mono-ADP-ribosyltransferase PARP14-like isoform X2 n=1 Tax=Gasterosteus aculeatus aculeatus TaxID=481459 RepID=UPI001A98B186|nr:protein mono-ADP-ribosyltransferase PARP14-like isoform X2 [Gasterosteus aculeatus aculeatus]
MEDVHRYPVFFDCPGLDGERQKKTERYFHVRRKSGGGDCGSITNVHGDVYSISFNKREDQERVLQKSVHVLDFGGVPLVLTVRSTPGPSTDPPITKLDPTSSQTQPSSLTSSRLTSDEEYELRLDPHLLRYLTECPPAMKELERGLASVACSAQLYPEEDRVLVSRLAQAGAPVSNWKAEVDKLFDGYLCHYEADPHKVKALLQPGTSRQATGEVKVYSEVGMVVVVGERSQVNARLMDIDSHVKQRPGHMKQKSTRRLGEAKLRLLWKEIEQRLRQDFPEVKVTQGAAGQIVLEGSVEEILKAGDCISQHENHVLERTVSDISPRLLAFLRKAYSGPGVQGDILGVGGNVEIELRDTEVRFFAVSADKLDDLEKRFQEMFKEVKIDIPICSSLPADLCEKLKTIEMNQGQHRAEVVFGPDSMVCLLGHTKEVQELNQVVIQFISDEFSIVDCQVKLPYPELVKLLPQLMKLHNFDISGVTIYPLTSSSQPTVVLKGSPGKVSEVSNRLGPFLQTLVQDRVTIALPGAVRYFESASGRDAIISVADSQKCLIQLQEQPHATRQILASGAGLSEVNTTVASYSLRDGFQVLVCQGDITKQEADVLVNAANEDLEHIGGVAAALSKAGGPEVQKECRALVKKWGKVPTGRVVSTTGGNLNCKSLLHAVGPVGGKSGGRERILLETVIQFALNSAESMGSRSIAIPCISSGVFGVPVALCSDAIVTAVKKFGSQGGRSLGRIILIDTRVEVVRAMQEACDRHLHGMSSGSKVPRDPGFQMGATAGAPEDGVLVEIVQGSLETQQVDCLVTPMVGHNPTSSRVGSILSQMAGPQLTAGFHKEAGGATLPGDTVLVVGLPSLQSKGVFFLNLLPWDNNPHGVAIQALRRGIRKVLTSCNIKGFSSVAFPVLGTGVALRFPHSQASKVLLEEVRTFKQDRVARTFLLVRFVIHPTDKDSRKAFQSAQETLRVGGFTQDADKAAFYCCVSQTNNEVTAMLGGVKLQMVRGDIINESVDAIINTTDFSKKSLSGVSKAIVTAAGPDVQAQLAQMGIPPDCMCTTGPGLLACREIIHASFKCDTQVIRKKSKKILKQCESKGYSSVAFPAINTGEAGMNFEEACNAMLDGMTSAISKMKPHSLTLIRIVILQPLVFRAFRSELEKRFGRVRPLGPKEKAKQLLKRLARTPKTSTPQGQTFMSSKPPPAVMSVISCGRETISTVQKNLEGILQKQLVVREVDVDHVSRLDGMELEAVQAKVKVSGISLECRRRLIPPGENSNRGGNAARGGAVDPSGSGEEVYVLTGLPEEVSAVVELVNRAAQKALYRELQHKEEAMYALVVQWSIREKNGTWRELSLRDNYLLEDAHLTQKVSVDVTSQDGGVLKVNLSAREATNWQTGTVYEVKRMESESPFELPAQWEPMHGDVFKKVTLNQNSAEYQAVAGDFVRTAQRNIQKIERLQNYHLWNAYSVCKQRISKKNDPADLGEMSLYHGTSAESSHCIERSGFNRSYAGDRVLYGKGVYFAVNAEYSASRYCPADASGLRRLYVARVLTGRYTLGEPSMKKTPARGGDPTDCFDSLVDNQQQPTMFVIFHDDQAYPEYLITFT